MATGDVKNNVRKLNFELRKLKYPQEPDLEGIVAGKWEAFYAIYQYLFFNFSPLIAQEVQDKLGLLPSAVNDVRFSEGVYRIFRDIYGYRPPITREQLVGPGFVERKIMMCTDVIQMIQKRHYELAATTPKAHGLKSSLVTNTSRTFFQRKDAKGSSTKVGRKLTHTNSAPHLPGVVESRTTFPGASSEICEAQGNGHDVAVTGAAMTGLTFWEFQKSVSTSLQKITQQVSELNLRVALIESRVKDFDNSVLIPSLQANGHS